MNYAALASMANRLITDAGRQVTFKRYAPTVTASTGVVVKGTSTEEETVYAVFMPAGKGTIEAFDNRLERGSLVDRTIRYCKVAAQDLTFQPRANDEMVMIDDADEDNETWRVLGCTPVNPAGTPIVYGIGVEKL